MIVYRFTIDGNIISEPGNIRGWDKLVTSVKRDSSDLKGILVTQDAKLSFIGPMYQYFYDIFYNSGICNEITILIEQSFNGITFETLFDGVIKISDLKLDEIQGIATTKIVDNSFYSRINNNKSIESTPNAGLSKNGDLITKCDVYEVDCFNCVNGNFVGTKKMFWLHDVFRYLVDFMSDGEVGFRSDYLHDEFLVMITNGYPLRTVSPSVLVPPDGEMWSVSFSKLMDNLKKNRDVSFQIELDANGKPTIRLEKSSYFYQDTGSTTFLNPTKINTSVDTKTLYSSVRLGSNPVSNDPSLSFPEDIKFNGFHEESFHILGQCNIDNEFNLVRDIAVSSNIIQYIIDQTGLIAPDTGYDSQLVFIVVENLNIGALTADAVKSNPSGSGIPVYYNMDLINAMVAESYSDSFQNSLASYIDIQTNDFRATVNNPVSYSDISVPAIPFVGAPSYSFPKINYQTKVDPGGNFNLATDSYTVPITGYYTLHLYAKYTVQGQYGNDLNRMYVGFRINNAGVLATVTNVHSFDGLFTAEIIVNAYLTIGTVLDTEFGLGEDGIFNQPLHQYFTLKDGSYFEATSTPDSGGIYENVNTEAIRNIFVETDTPLTPQQFKNVLATLRNKQNIEWTEKNRTYSGWIDSLSYNHKTEIAKIILKSSINAIK